MNGANGGSGSRINRMTRRSMSAAMNSYSGNDSRNFNRHHHHLAAAMTNSSSISSRSSSPSSSSSSSASSNGRTLTIPISSRYSSRSSQHGYYETNKYNNSDDFSGDDSSNSEGDEVIDDENEEEEAFFYGEHQLAAFGDPRFTRRSNSSATSSSYVTATAAGMSSGDKCRIHDKFKDDEFEPDEEHSKISYCYLCSIQAHVHEKTEPVPMHKRRYLKPYFNPMQLVKRFNDEQSALDVKTKYKFTVKTGPGIYSGTNATVWFKLTGSAGEWSQTELRTPLKKFGEIKFPADSLVEIQMEGPVIGDLEKLKIWHDGRTIKDGWLLEYVDVYCFKLKQTWRFMCNRWLSKQKPPDFKSCIILSLVEGRKNLTDPSKDIGYYVVVKTGREGFVGSESYRILFQMVGTKGQTAVFDMLTPYVNIFEKNQLDAFLITSSIDLGAPEKIRMAHEHLRLSNRWQVEEIRVFYSREPTKCFIFSVDNWVEKNNRMNAVTVPREPISLDVGNSPETAKVIYYITVITGSTKLAGTDARVFIEIHGKNGVTQVHRLHNRKAKKEFHRDQVNHFHIFDVNVGQIKYIRIWHDNSGLAPGWFLDTVLIKCMSTSLSGNKEKFNVELKLQLDDLTNKVRKRNESLTRQLTTDKEERDEERSPDSTMVDDDDESSKRRRKTTEAEGGPKTGSAATAPIPKPRATSADSTKSGGGSSSSKSRSRSKSKKNRKGSGGANKTKQQQTADAVDGVPTPKVINYKEVLKKNIVEQKRSSTTSPSPSILKTSASPRNSRDKKQVKFDGNNPAEHRSFEPDSPSSSPRERASRRQNHDNAADKDIQAAPLIDMKLSWLLSVFYHSHSNSNDENAIKKISTIEQYDRHLHKLDEKAFNQHQQSRSSSSSSSIIKAKREQQSTKPAIVDARQGLMTTNAMIATNKQSGRIKSSTNSTTSGSSNQSKFPFEKLIYVLECKKWLARDMEDGRTERVLKPNSILETK